MFQPNMTFHLVPHVVVAGAGTCSVSGTVLVRGDRGEVLIDFPRWRVDVPF